MADSGTSSRNEKASIVRNPESSRRFFSKKRVSKTVNTDEKTEIITDVKPQEEEVPPVSVRQLFR